MTAVEHQPAGASAVDDGSWIYLSCAAEDEESQRRLYDRVARACEASGWRAVSWSLAERRGRAADPGHFFEGVRHAVGHADVVIAFIGPATEVTDAELALAYSYRRPIVGVCISDEAAPGVQAMLRSYDRARVIDSLDDDRCIADLRAIFADPDFAEAVRLAAGGNAEDV